MGSAKVTLERRAQIVQGLEEVMATRGYEGASIKAIAAAAGLGPGLVHYHFDSKQAILLALVERLVEGLERRLERLETTASTPRERLDAFIDAHLALGDDADPAGVRCWVLIAAEAIRQPEVREAYRRAVRRDLDELRERVAAVLESTGGEVGEAPEIAAALMAAIHGAMQLASSTGQAPKGFAARRVRQMATGLLDAARGRS